MTAAPFHPVPPVPPGSMALREFCHAVIGALTIPDTAEPSAMRLVDYGVDAALLCLYRDRTGLVVSTMRRMLADREIDRNFMVFVASLREQVSR